MKTVMARFGRSIGLVLGVLLALAVPGMAQSTRGALTGTITDATGALIPNASVVAVNATTGVKNETVSTSSGDYRFTELAVGTYTVTVKAAGFQVGTATGVTVSINSVSALNVSLKVGEQSETVTVDASGLRLQTATSDIGGTISQKQIEDLPLSIATGVGGLRSPETFAFLIPGTTGPGTGGSAPFQGNGVFLSKLGGGQN